jgi:hypothetical protein
MPVLFMTPGDPYVVTASSLCSQQITFNAELPERAVFQSSLLIKVDHHNAGQVLHIETECATTHDSELVLDLSLCEVRPAPKRTLFALLVIMHLDLDCTLAVQ